jgi:hypothetical protein
MFPMFSLTIGLWKWCDAGGGGDEVGHREAWLKARRCSGAPAVVAVGGRGKGLESGRIGGRVAHRPAYEGRVGL